MLSWFKKTFAGRKNETHDEMTNRVRPLISQVVPDYGEIMEKWPLVIFPTSKLPLPKQEMKVALQLAWYQTNNPQLRGFLAHGYAHLCQFRDDVLTPIDPTMPEDATPYEATQILSPYLAIAKQIEADRAALAAEYEEFERLAGARTKRA
ncbi:MAG: hypothetical protein QOF22_150 [Bradyrhizobium sp.]|jgi:hypothetical protein|nr:hypothetical protein [Bradyrhizobium sp.]